MDGPPLKEQYRFTNNALFLVTGIEASLFLQKGVGGAKPPAISHFFEKTARFHPQ
jgi:hypothetical protein